MKTHGVNPQMDEPLVIDRDGTWYLGSEEASYSWEAHLARVTLWGEQEKMVWVEPGQAAAYARCQSQASCHAPQLRVSRQCPTVRSS